MSTHEHLKPKPPAPRRADHPPAPGARRDLVPHAVLSGGSNALIGAYLARTPAVKAPAKDPAAMTDAELEREADRASKRLIATDTKSREWNARNERAEALQEEQDRRYKVKEERGLAQEGLAESVGMIRDAEAINRELRELVQLLNESLTDSEAKIREWLGYYGEAHGQVTKALGKAKEDAAFREAIINFCIGIAVGTGVGLVGGALFEGVKGLGKVMAEMGGELTEQAVANPLQIQSAAKFELPPGMETSVRAAAAWERMADAWKSAALFNTVLLDFSNYRDHVRKSQGELAVLAQGGKSPRLASEVLKELRDFKRNGGPGQFRAQQAAVRGALVDFRRTMHHPTLRKIAYEIEQDIWIHWISGLRNGGDNPLKTRFPGPAGMDPRVHDALDEDAVEARLNAIGLIGEKSRLGVDFGWNTSPTDTGDAYDAAVAEEARLQQLGRIGVVIEPAAMGKPGVVHIRRSAYRLADRAEPETLPEGYFRAVGWSGSVGKGQVVSVEGTSRLGLEVAPVFGATGLGKVDAADEANVMWAK